jgi:hypothetical protein
LEKDMWSRHAAGAMVVFALVTVACGGSDDETTLESNPWQLAEIVSPGGSLAG